MHPTLRRFSFWFAAVFAESLEARCQVEYEDVVGAAPTGDAPTTSEWSTILLPTKVRLILEILRYSQTLGTIHWNSIQLYIYIYVWGEVHKTHYTMFLCRNWNDFSKTRPIHFLFHADMWTIHTSTTIIGIKKCKTPKVLLAVDVRCSCA